MSKIRSDIEEEYKTALKDGNKVNIKALRLLKSAIKDKDISLRSQKNKEKLTDEVIFKLLQSLIKQRKESMEIYSKAGREELAKGELDEIKVIENFLPKQLEEKEIKELINKIIKEEKITSIKDMGKVMSILKSKYAGEVDMSIAGKLAKTVIQEIN